MLNNDFEKLLKYLDTLEEKKPEIDSTKLINNKQIIVETKTKESVSDAIDKLIEESQDNLFETPFIVQPNGFDITRFENQMRSKLIEEHKKIQSYDRPYISISELFSCMRSTYYNRLKYEIDIKALYKFPYLKLYQEIGNAIHEVIQSSYDFSEKEKTIISEKYKVKGRLDALKENFVYEIKSTDSEKFSGTYEQDHYSQGNIYAKILNDDYNYHIDTIVIIYILRDKLGQRPKVFELPFDDKKAEEFLIKGNALNNYIQKKEVPPPIGASETHCQYCLYKRYCENDGNNLKNVNKKPEKSEIVFLI